MANKPPASGYRTPPPSDRDSGPGRQPLFAADVPLIGGVEVDLPLVEPLTLQLDRNRVGLDLGRGLHIQFSAPVPPFDLRHIGLCLNNFDVTLAAEGLGPLAERLASIGVREVSGRLLGIDPVGYTGPGDSLVSDFLDSLDGDGCGCRKFYEVALPFGLELGVWLSPASQITVEATGEQLTIFTTEPVVFRAPLIRLGLFGIVYRFSDGHLELRDRTPDASFVREWLNAVLLFVIGFWARRMLRNSLPAAMISPGYNLFTDPDLQQNLAALRHRLGPARRPAEATGGSAFAHMFDAGLTCDDLPANARVLHRVNPRPGIDLALCTDDLKKVHVQKDPTHVGISAGAGLFVHCDQIPDLASIRIRGADVELPSGALKLDLDPAPGPVVAALIRHVSDLLILPRVPAFVRPHIGLGVESPGAAHELLRRTLSGGRELKVLAQADTSLNVDYTPEALLASIEPPLKVELGGSLGFLPNLNLSKIRYALADGQVALTTDPAVGPLEQSVLSALVLLASPMMPAVVRPAKPGAFAPVPADLETTHSRILLSRATPAGPIAIRLSDSDRLTVRLTPTRVEFESSHHIVVHAPMIGLALEFKAAGLDLASGAVTLDLTPECGAFVTHVASSAVKELALDHLRRLLPKPPKPGAPWELRRVEVRPGEALRLSLPADGAMTVVRTPNHLTVRAERGVRVQVEGSLPAPEFSLHELDWHVADNSWSVTTSPKVGPVTQALVNRVIDRFLPATLTKWLCYLGLPEPPAHTSKVPPPLHGPVLFEYPLPQLGPARVALDRDHSLRVGVSREQLELTFGRGLLLRSLGLDLSVKVLSARLSLGTRTIDVETEPALGDLEHQILRRAVGQVLESALSNILPEAGNDTEESEVVLTVGRKTKAGPVHICVPPGRGFEYILDKKGCALRSTAGIQLRGTSEALAWLPEFSLHELRYTFQSGDMSIDISGIEERFYHEEDDVSPITEAICAHIFRLMVAPKIPKIADRLGFVRHPQPPEIELPTERIGLFAGELGAVGGLFITMDPDDTLTIRASGEEVSVNCLLGLQLALPGLRLQLEIRHARYHPKSGEVQLGGLGQLENAIVEEVLRKRFARKKTQNTDLEPLAALLENLPITKDGKRKLYESKVVNLYMHPKARFTVRCGAEGIELLTDPPITVDGPSIVDYHFEGVSFEFSEGRFRVEMANEGNVPDIFTDIVIGQIEKKLGQLFLPLLPQAMRDTSYNLAEDPNSVETIATLFANVSTARGKRA